ncbi:MAG: tetratricopeptide repeat protein [Gammaproteobacteria bacterium]|nr:tetratricopeptide repeat protein [Gammaproteobacteria bacterium]NIR84955.1 tetratricopeptide repeat protein [Gammaproteobacteria bacterium]NIR91804.1 tetratricopeptide repeat protein [Gammaproteobacteria bacterium]NIU06002.1 tetratricopeptide repeat protein [Gammaproteobacteria bacterium]NIV53049.1 tetratricopeptide repeat protein [Gammaproteobacteria bacterium]
MYQKLSSALCVALLYVSVAAAEPSLSEIHALADGGDYEGALTELDALLEAQPDHIEGRLYKGVLLQRQGRLAEAIETFRSLAEAHPELPEPLNNLAVLYAAQGRHADAHQALLDAIDADPEYDTAHENLGDLHVRLASIAYRRAYALNKDNQRVRQKSELLTAMIGVGVGENAQTAADEPRATASPAGVSAADASNKACYEIGRFSDQASAQVAADWLRDEAGADTSLRGHEDSGERRYLVYLPPFETRAAAASRMEQLQGAGIRDIAVIGDGPRANAVSLGIFSTQDRAKRRLTELRERGYEAQSAPLSVTKSTWSIDVAAPEDRDLRVSAFQETFPGRDLRPVDCTELGR